jgi:hypothetical protein
VAEDIIAPRTIVVADECLQLFLPCQTGVARVGHNVDDRDSIQSNHLFKVDVSTFISVDVVHGKSEVGPVRIGFEDVSPVRIRSLGNGDVQEDSVGARLQDRVSLSTQPNVRFWFSGANQSERTC